MKAAVGIDGDHDLALGGGEPGIADSGKILGLFVNQPASRLFRDLGGAVGAAIEDDNRFNLARAERTRFLNRGESFRKKLLFVVRGDDDGNFDFMIFQ